MPTLYKVDPGNLPVCACGKKLTLYQAQRGNKTCSRRCGAERTKAQRSAWMKAYVKTLTYEQKAERGRKGGRSTDVARWGALLEKWMSGAPRDALHAAYRQGYHAGFQSKQRAQRNREPAA